MFLKREKQNLCENYFVLCLYNRFRSFNLVCVALEYCASAFKVTSFEIQLCCNKEFICLLVSPFVETCSKNGKSDASNVFYWGFLFVCKTMQHLKAA